MNNPTISGIRRFLFDHAFALMLAGMAITGTGFFFFMKYRYFGEPRRTLLISVTIFGVVIYFIGRISLALGRRTRTGVDRSEADSSDSDNQ